MSSEGLSAASAATPRPGGPAQAVRMELHEDAASLGRWTEAWAAMCGEFVFRRPDWGLTWWRHFAEQGDRLHVLTVHDEANGLLGVAPWYLRQSLGRGRELHFLGDGEVCSDYLSLVCAAGAEERVGAAIGQWLCGAGQGHWDGAVLAGVARDDQAMVALAAECQNRDCLVDAAEIAHCWRVEFPATWDEYVQGMSRSRRERVRQLVRKYFDSGRATGQTTTDVDDLEQGWGILVDLHQRRRQALGQAGCFSSERFTRFHREIVEAWLPHGMARLHWTLLDGRPVAVEYDLIGAGTMHLYQTGMEPDMAQDSPGTLGTILALRTALESGCKAFDFLRGDESYKTHWRTAARPLVEYRLTADLPGARWRRRMRLAALGAKSWAKSLLRREKSPPG